MRLSVGTHNLLDGEGTATPFARLLLFTEAPRADVVRQQLGTRFTVRSCPQQRDLLLAWDHSRVDVEELRTGAYYIAHQGVPKVTPQRGTWVTDLVIEGHRVKVPIGHRINAAFPPYIRGEAAFRRRNWQHHKRIDRAIIRLAIRDGWDVIAGGDLNTPPTVLGYPAGLGLTEAKRGLDRIATTGHIAAGSVEVLSNAGSDHPRLRVEVVL